MGGRHAELTLDGELRESQPRPPQSPLSQVLGRVSQSTTFLSFISCFIINFMLAGGHGHRAGNSEHVGDQVVGASERSKLEAIWEVRWWLMFIQALLVLYYQPT